MKTTCLLAAVLLLAPPTPNHAAQSEEALKASQYAPATPKLATTPPMGWNSYDAFGDSVTEAEVLANAEYMKEKLLPYGWNYVVIDFRWYDPVITLNDHDLTRNRTGAMLAADSNSRLLPSPEKFPSAKDGEGFKPLADRIHAMGLKFGLHIMRGIPRQAALAKTPIEGSQFTADQAANTNSKCGWCPDMYGVVDSDAGQAWYDSCARLWARWGVDFVKVDDLSSPYSASEVEMIRKAIDKCGRPIIFSTSPGPTPANKADHIKANANMWRISGDFWDEWPKLRHQLDLMADWDRVGGPGGWPDADMIPFGHIGIRCYANYPASRWTRFSHDEQIFLMTLWCIAPSPLMLGMNLPDNDAWTLSLITNKEALDINQDPLGSPARWVVKYRRGEEVWARELSGGKKALAIFNTAEHPLTVEANLDQAGITGKYSALDIWQGKKKGPVEGTLTETIPAHGAAFFLLMPVSQH